MPTERQYAAHVDYWRERAQDAELRVETAEQDAADARARAERAETALRDIAEDRGPLGEPFTGTYQMRDFARAALGETT